MFDYLDVLTELHAARQTKTYLEIGISMGSSLERVHEGAICIGVDPEPEVPQDIAARCHIEKMTSDAFFAGPRLSELTGNESLDLTFIDGMHLFEFALRDFMNAEAHSHTDSMIVVHDCLPQDALTSTRERTTVRWTGDVWKLMLCLPEYRPDLEISLVDVPPSGLLLVTGLSPQDRVLQDNYADIVARFIPLGFDEWLNRKAEIVRQLTSTFEAEIWRARCELALAQEQITELERQLRDVYQSKSWRITAPIRRLNQVRRKGH